MKAPTDFETRQLPMPQEVKINDYLSCVCAESVLFDATKPVQHFDKHTEFQELHSAHCRILNLGFECMDICVLSEHQVPSIFL